MSRQVVEQVIRPTGLLDPTIEMKPTKGQIDDLMQQIKDRVDKSERCLVTTLTKRMAEELADYLQEMGVRTHYLHSTSTPWSAAKSCGTCAWGFTTLLWASTCSGRGWTCPR